MGPRSGTADVARAPSRRPDAPGAPRRLGGPAAALPPCPLLARHTSSPRLRLPQTASPAVGGLAYVRWRSAVWLSTARLGASAAGAETPQSLRGRASHPGRPRPGRHRSHAPLGREARSRAARHRPSCGLFSSHRFPPYPLGAEPVRLGWPVTTGHAHQAATLRVLGAPRRRHRINASPPSRPVEMAGARHGAHPMRAVPRQHTAPCDRQDAVVKGRMGLGKRPFGLSRRPACAHECRPLPIAPLRPVSMLSRQEPLPPGVQRCVTPCGWLWHVGLRGVQVEGVRDDHGESGAPLPMRTHHRHHRLPQPRPAAPARAARGAKPETARGGRAHGKRLRLQRAGAVVPPFRGGTAYHKP
jgi:hypothetical protein